MEFRDVKEEGMGISVKTVAAQSLGPGMPPIVAQPDVFRAMSLWANVTREDVNSEYAELLGR